MSDKYEFPNHPADERYADNLFKGGLDKDLDWIGIANSTKHNLKVRTVVGRDAAGDIFEKVNNLLWVDSRRSSSSSSSSSSSVGDNFGVEGPSFNLELQV